jgi:magnesium transporter
VADETGVVRSRVWRDGKQLDEDFDFDKISDYLEDQNALVWVDICDPNHSRLDELARELCLDPLAVEDAVTRGERAKATRYATHTFLTAYSVTVSGNDDLAQSQLEVHRISAFVLPHGIVTVRHGSAFDMDAVVARWDENLDLLRYGVGALVHGLLDVIVDGHFEAVQVMDDAIELLEDDLFDDRRTNNETQRRTFRLRKDLVELRRVVLPMREVVNAVLRHRKDLNAASEMDPYFDDLYDHVLRASEWTESLRDLITTIFETNLSLQDARLNNVMKQLTAWAAIIAVPTAITGYFGQNVPYPGFEKEWGFLFSTVAILIIAGALYIGFKKRKWL